MVASGVTGEAPQFLPAVAATRLPDGGSVIAWRSTRTLFAQMLDAGGAPRGTQIQIDTPIKPALIAVAAQAGGDWVLVWFEETFPSFTQFSAPYTLRMRRYGAAGELKQAVDAVLSGSIASFTGLQVAPTQDGGFFLAWASSPQLGAPQFTVVRRYDAAGQQQGQELSLVSEEAPRLAVLPDGSVVLGTMFSGNGTRVSVRHLDASGAQLGQPVVVEATRSTDPVLKFDIAALADGRVGLAWGSAPTASDSIPGVRTQILDAAGTPVTAPASTTTFLKVERLSAAVRSTGFAVFVQDWTGFSRGTNATLSMVPVAADGAMGPASLVASTSLSSVSPTTGATTGPASFGFAVAAGRDDHFILGYENAVVGGAQLMAEGR